MSGTSAASRFRRALRWLAAPLRPFFVALVPHPNVGREVIAGRYGLPLLSVVICACVAAFALGTRLDAGPEVRAENAGAPAPSTAAKAKPANADSKQAEIKTDREIDDAIAQRTAVTRVKLGMG